MIKKLPTGTVLNSWNYDTGNREGQAVAVKNGYTGGYDMLLEIESVRCAEGKMNRIILKKSIAKEHGFHIIED